MPKKNAVLNALSNVRLTIILLIIITLASVLGTLVPQNLSPREYLEIFGPGKAKLILKTGLSDLYHSPGFIVLLGLLALNLVACTWKRRFARLGPSLTHVSILLILLGGVVGALTGFSGMVIITEGSESSAAWDRKGDNEIPLGFRVRLNRFVFEQYANGTPKEYRSEVTLLDPEGRKIRDAHIRVNHPIKQNGIKLYQSTYGTTAHVTLEVQNRETGEITTLTTRLKNPFDLPGTRDSRAVAANFKEDFHIPPQMVRMTDFPREHMGPAVQIVPIGPGGMGEPFWIFRDFPEHGLKKDAPFHFVLTGHHAVSYTGLEAARDPGTPLVWLGCILLMAGIVISFWRKERKRKEPE